MNEEKLRVEFESLALKNGLNIDCDFYLTKPPKFARYTSNKTQDEWIKFKEGKK